MNRLRTYIKYIFPFIVLLLISGLLLTRVLDKSPTHLIPEASIDSADALEYIGLTMEVCGTVVSAETVFHLKGKPTFINFGSPHPNQEFTAVLWAREREKHDFPSEYMLVNRIVCVTGRIKEHNGVPQIRLIKPWQLVLY